MKVRIAEMQDGTFQVQEKDGFFSCWEINISNFFSLEDAKKRVVEILEEQEKQKKLRAQRNLARKIRKIIKI